MGSPSVSIHRGLVQWQRLLLVVSLLTFWSPPTTAKIYVKWSFVLEGNDKLLKIENKPPEAIGVVWYKGKDLHHKNIVAFFMRTTHYHLSGPGYKGEEMLTHDGSLLLKNVTKKDEGVYTVVVHLPDSKTETGFGRLDVYDREKWRVVMSRLEKFKRCKEGVEKDCFYPEWRHWPTT